MANEDFSARSTQSAFCVEKVETNLSIVLAHYGFEHKLLALQMTIAGEEVVVVAKIEWQRGTGLFPASGATFVTKLDHFPA